MHARRKTKGYDFSVHTPDKFAKGFIPVQSLPMQYALRVPGIPKQSMVEIIGPEKVGKSTLIWWLLGQLMRNNCVPLYIETEKKPLLPDRIKRALHTNPAIADAMFRNIPMHYAHSVGEAVDILHTWLQSMRSPEMIEATGITPDVTLVVAFDTWTKLMSRDEAASIGPYETTKQSASADVTKSLELGGGSNFTFSKDCHRLTRTLASLFDTYNFIMLVGSHQNDKISMTGGGFGMAGEEVSAMYNKTRQGGKAFNQTAAMQFIMQSAGQIKNSDNVPTGHVVKVRVDKNTYGPDNGKFEFAIHKIPNDTVDELDPAVHFFDSTAKMFADMKLLGTTAAKKRYTCADLGADGATAEEFTRLLHANEDVWNRVCGNLGIHGYSVKEFVPKDEAEESVG